MSQPHVYQEIQELVKQVEESNGTPWENNTGMIFQKILYAEERIKGDT